MDSLNVKINLNSSLSIDDVCKIRILDASTTEKTDRLRNECNDFMESTNNFQQVVEGFLAMIESLAKNVENEKMKAIGASNLISSISKIRETEQMQLQTQLMEKTIELERLRLQYQSLLKSAQEQEEYIELLVTNK
ncbi:intraflagellar transport protein 20 homolog [Planococcus citri]|uniref:intraflagellar transport protein 20 homolog n=1 Tax=Planococcus citri TaxID=170843 RepID=UPI0031F9C6F2